MEKTLTLNSQISQVCNDDSKCIVCKGIEDPSIIVISKLQKEKNFIKLICNKCLTGEEYFLKSTISQASTQESSQIQPSNLNSQLQNSQISENKQEEEKKEQKQEDGSNDEQEIYKQIEEQLDKFHLEIRAQTNDSANDNKQSEEGQKMESVVKVKSDPVFIIEPHHLQFELDDFISQFDSSLKTQKFELFHKSTELSLFLKNSLRIIFDIQTQVENMHEEINKATFRAEDLIFKLKEANHSSEKQILLSEMMECLELKENKVTAQIQEYKFTKEIKELQCKLEYLSESLQPEIFQLNSLIYQTKKQTVEICNEMLLKLNIQQKWKQYSDVQMNQESMTAGMRGVYRFHISQNGQVSQGTNTGYVYLAMDTKENYIQYTFQNLTPLQNTKTNSYSYYNTTTKDPIAHKLANYFLDQRNKIIELQYKISQILK